MEALRIGSGGESIEAQPSMIAASAPSHPVAMGMRKVTAAVPEDNAI